MFNFHIFLLLGLQSVFARPASASGRGGICLDRFWRYDGSQLADALVAVDFLLVPA